MPSTKLAYRFQAIISGNTWFCNIFRFLSMTSHALFSFVNSRIIFIYISGLYSTFDKTRIINYSKIRVSFKNHLDKVYKIVILDIIKFRVQIGQIKTTYIEWQFSNSRWCSRPDCQRSTSTNQSRLSDQSKL